MITFFRTQNIRPSFSVILLLFSINMVKECTYLKNSTVCTKTCQKWKPTQDDYVFYPNLSYIIFNHFVTSIQLKNITVTSLGHLVGKLPKVTNQYKITCFSTQTICTSFLVILLLIPTNMVKECSEQKNRTLNTKTCQK